MTLFLADLETSPGSSSDSKFADTWEGRGFSPNSIGGSIHGSNKQANIAANGVSDQRTRPGEGMTRLQNRPYSSSSSQRLQTHPHLPLRSSSFQNVLPASSVPGEAPYSLTPPSSEVIYEQSQRPNSSRSASGQLQSTPRQNVPASALAGIKDLAASRADLYLLQRRLLDHLARLRQWDLGWSAGNGADDKKWKVGRGAMKEVNLNNGAEENFTSRNDHKADEGIAEGNDEDLDFKNHILAAMPSINAARGLYEVCIRVVLPMKNQIKN